MSPPKIVYHLTPLPCKKLTPLKKDASDRVLSRMNCRLNAKRNCLNVCLHKRRGCYKGKDALKFDVPEEAAAVAVVLGPDS